MILRGVVHLVRMYVAASRAFKVVDPPERWISSFRRHLSAVANPEHTPRHQCIIHACTNRYCTCGSSTLSWTQVINLLLYFVAALPPLTLARAIAVAFDLFAATSLTSLHPVALRAINCVDARNRKKFPTAI